MWVFVLLQHASGPRLVTNVGDDGLLTSKVLTALVRPRRCLLPASSYCEPNAEKPAKWFWFAAKGEDVTPGHIEDRRLFAFASIWRRWKGPHEEGRP
ncbi:SOS response-associated peptidase family protein [Hyphomicrobium sp. B1]|uniref:SOS response-associated peptidase family protein n=1 Tax=Hyphomicrobium sp. B1 TaxID=3075651 RepID=UPI003C2EE5C1